jgi:energy-coupling factor transporter ATP-binding protein EcfA2
MSREYNDATPSSSDERLKKNYPLHGPVEEMEGFIPVVSKKSRRRQNKERRQKETLPTVHEVQKEIDDLAEEFNSILIDPERLCEINQETHSRTLRMRGTEFEHLSRLHSKHGFKMRGNGKKPHAATSDPTLDAVKATLAEVPEEQKGEAERWLRMIESLGLLSYQLARSQNITDVLVASAAFLKCNVLSGSITRMIADLSGIFDDIPHEEATTTGKKPNAGEDDVSFSSPTLFSTFAKNWHALTRNKNWKHIHVVISGLASMLVADFKGIDWTIGCLSVVKVMPWDDLRTSVDFIDALIKALDYMWSTGYRCLMEGSLKPLMFEDQKIQAFETAYTEIMAKRSLAYNGNMEDIPQFEHKVNSLLADCKAMKAMSYEGWQGYDLQQKYVALSETSERLLLKHKSCTQRMQPVGVLLNGDSGVGKSSILTILAKVMIQAIGMKYDPTRCVALDIRQPYEDILMSNIQVLYLDELANAKFGTTQVNHTVVVKKHGNVIPCQANKSAVDEKARVFPQPDILLATTNKKDLDAGLYSNCPESILRVFLTVTMEVLPKFRKPGSLMLDSEHPELLSRTIENPGDDVFSFTIEDIQTYKAANGQETLWKHVPFWGTTNEGRKISCVNLKYSVFLEVIANFARNRHAAQMRTLTKDAELKAMDLCECGTLPGFCKCSKKVPPPKPIPVFVPKEQYTTEVEEEDSVDPADNDSGYSTPDEDDDWEDEKQKSSFARKRILARLKKRGKIPHGDVQGIENMITSAVSQAAKSWFSNLFYLGPIEKLTLKMTATSYLISEVESLMEDTCTPWILSIIPDTVITTKLAQTMIDRIYMRSAERDCRRLHVWLWRLLVAYFFYVYWLWFKGEPVGAFFAFGLFCICVLSVVRYVHKVALKKSYLAELETRRDALPTSVKKFRDHRYLVPATCAGFTLGLIALRAWNRYRLLPQAEEDNPLSPSAIDQTPGWMGFFLGAKKLDVEASAASKTATLSQLEAKCVKNLWTCEFTRPDSKPAFCSVLVPRKSVVLFPRHLFYPKFNMNGSPYAQLTLTMKRNDKPGGHLSPVIVEWSDVYVFPDTDMVAAFVPTCPDVPSITKWFPLSLPEGEADAKFITHTRVEGVRSDTIRAKFRMDGHDYMQFYGPGYKSHLVKSGACMGLILSEEKNPCILGVHMSGGDGVQLPTNHGSGASITQDDLDLAYKALSENHILSAEAWTIPSTQYGKPVVIGPPHPKSEASKKLPHAAFTVVGATQVRAQQKSSVIPSYLAEEVAKEFEYSKRYAGPMMFPNWKAYNKALGDMEVSEAFFPPCLLKRARNDWMEPMKNLMSRYKGLRVLTDREAVMGIDGVRFMDPLKMSTGMGFPVMGPKRPHFTEEFDESGKLVDRIPSQEIQDEMDRLISCWNEGKRGYPVFRACLKDEPKEEGSTKVRVFQCAPVAFSIQLRKYFLPLIRFIGLHPVESECAVGINCFSPQWEALMDAAKSKGEERTLAWDYSKYDLTMGSQVTREVMGMLIELAEIGGYPGEALQIMRMMICDLTHALVDWDGTMLMLTSVNVSGHNMTVQLNSVANGLYMRMAFFSIYPRADNFRSAVSMTTYGDDALGTVAQEFEDFNYLTYHAWCARYNKKITPPDKEAEGTKFINGADFLKRKSNYIPEIGHTIGCIDTDSLMKSMLANVASAEPPKTVARSVLASTMHEIFAHGRETYEEWQVKLKRVCKTLDIVEVDSVEKTFDERVEHWKQKYLG